MKRIGWAMGVCAALVAAGIWLLCGDGQGVAAEGPSEADKPGGSRLIKTVTRDESHGGKPRKAARANAKPVLSLSGEDDEDEKRTPEEKKLAADIEKALDEEDFELAKTCAAPALNCKVTEIRQAMVDTLGWFGEKALPELTPFMADADEDIAESAMNEWESAVSAIEDEGEKIGSVELAMQVISNEDALESISGEYIGIDEKLAVESLLRIIEGDMNARGVAKAKETYEFVTGEEFTSRADAEKWIAEEYQPQEP